MAKNQYTQRKPLYSGILRIQGQPVRPKLGMILENQVVQKLKLEKNVFTKNGLLKWYS